MNIEAYIIAFNEAEIIEKTVKYYLGFCSRVIIFDNFSTDNTRDIATAAGAEVRMFGINGVLSDKQYLMIKNNEWKKSTADWVIVCDADEILWHPFLNEALKEKCTIFQTYGWNVYSEEMPENLLDIKTGFYDGNYSKSVIFNPKAIKEINYHYGCHIASPKGEILFSKEVLTLFHYRNIGGYKRLSDRHELYRSRLSQHNREKGLGIHYLFDEKKRKKEWYEYLNGSGGYVPPGGSYVSPQIQNPNTGLKYAVLASLEGG